MNRGRNKNGQFWSGLGTAAALIERDAETLPREPDFIERGQGTLPQEGPLTYPRAVAPPPIATRVKPTPLDQPIEIGGPPAPLRAPTTIDGRELGAVGTPNLAGFISDLGEYNPSLEGLDGIRVFEKMRRQDPTVAALEEAVCLPIVSAQWRVEPPEGDESPLGKQVAEQLEDNLLGGLEYTDDSGAKHSQTWESVLRNALLCAPLGCSGSEDIWEMDSGRHGVRLARLAPRMPITFYQFVTYPDGEILKTLIQFGYRRDTVDLFPVPASKITLHSFKKEGAYFYGRSMFRPAYQPWYFKSHLMVIDAIGAERNRMATPVIKQGPNASPPDVEKSWTWAQNLTTNERAALSLPYQWDFLWAGITGRAVDLTASLRYYDEQIADAGLAGFLSLGKTATGSRALGDVKMNFFLLGLNALANLIAENYTATTLRRWTVFNYPEARKNPYEFPWPRLTHSDITILNVTDLVEAISKAGHAAVGWLNPTMEGVKYLCQRLGLPAGEKVIPRFNPVQIREIENLPTGETVWEIEDPGVDHKKAQQEYQRQQQQGMGDRGQGTGREPVGRTSASEVRGSSDALLYSPEQARDERGRWTSMGLPEARTAALDPAASRETLRGLARHPEALVRRAVAMHSNTPLETLERLSRDPEPQVSYWAKRAYKHKIGQFSRGSIAATESDALLYSPDQPREPAGSPEGGRWSPSGDSRVETRKSFHHQGSEYFEENGKFYARQTGTWEQRVSEVSKDHFEDMQYVAGLKPGDRIPFVRYGQWVERSYNYRDRVGEAGMSVYAVRPSADGERIIKAGFPYGITDRRESRGVGTFVGLGSDGEPLVVDAQRVAHRQSVAAVAAKAADAYRQRDQASPFWRDGHPPELRNVHASEIHVDFPAHEQAMDAAEGRVKRLLLEHKRGLVRAMAEKTAGALKDNRPLASLAFDHPDALEAGAKEEAARLHKYFRGEMYAEHDRLRSRQQTADSRQEGAAALSTVYRPPSTADESDVPGLVAEISADDYSTELARAVKKSAADLKATADPSKLTKSEIADLLWQDVMAPPETGIPVASPYLEDRISAELVRRGAQEARAEAAQEISEALVAAGVEPNFFRVAILDKNVCENCAREDGAEWPINRPLSVICAGDDACRCELIEG